MKEILQNFLSNNELLATKKTKCTAIVQITPNIEVADTQPLLQCF
jgi:hypothetical protein